MKKNLFKRYGFLVLGATFALNAFSEPVVESRSATSSSNDYPFDSAVGSDGEIIETTTVKKPPAADPNVNPFEQPVAGPAPTATLEPLSVPMDASGETNNPIQAVNHANATQQELQELRGMVEELQYKLQQLEQQQKERYIDVDRRLQALGGGAGAASSASANTVNTGSEDAPTSAASAPAASAAEKNEYDAAFNVMTKDKNFEKATSAFNQFVKKYPKGTYTANAWYWLGKLYSFDANNLTKSRDAFQQVVKNFPTSSKAADALYELGVTQDKMGSKDQAQKTLKSVSTQYPGTGAATKAEQYLQGKTE